MSGRRLLNCTSCRQKHYVPTGARCPYKPGEKIPSHLLPSLSQEDLSQSPSDAENASETDSQPGINRHPSMESLSESDFEISSAQKQQPQPSTSTEVDVQLVTLQQFSDATTGRVQQLEEERAQMRQVQQELLTQQRSLQEALDTMSQRLSTQASQAYAYGLQPNPDVRAKLTARRLYSQLPVNQPGQNVDTQSQHSQIECPSDRPRMTTSLDPQAMPITPATSQQMVLNMGPPMTQHDSQSTHSQTGQLQQQIWPPTGPPLRSVVTEQPPMTGIEVTQHQNRPVLTAADGRIPLWNQASLTSTQPQQATLTDLRTDRALMNRAAQVVSTNTQDTQEQGKMPKSGLKRDNTEQVCRVIPWPHVLRNQGKPPTYESLSLSEFAAGNMRILAKIPNTPPLLVHITDTEWPSV